MNVLLSMGQQAFTTPVEIEFSVNLFQNQRKPDFYILQIRLMVAGPEDFMVAIDPGEKSRSLCYGNHAIGNVIYANIRDIIYVNPNRFDLTQSSYMALETKEPNKQFIQNNSYFVIADFGQWGTSDLWLGF